MVINNRNRITIVNIASTIILQGLAFFSGPIFSGILGTNNFGIVSVYSTWVQLASIILSLQTGGTISLARINISGEEQTKYQSSILFLASLSYFSFSALIILGNFFLSFVNMYMLLFGLIHGWGWYCVSFMNSKFTYEFKAEKNFVLSVSTSVLTIGTSLILIYIFPDKINYWGRILGQSLIYFVIGCSIFLYIMKAGKTTYNLNYWKFALPIAVPTIFHLLANIVLNQSDRVMIQNIIGNSSAGIYSLAYTFGTALSTIWTALNNSWTPFYYEYTQNNQIEKINRHAKNYVELFSIITMGFILLSREVFHLYAKPDFWSGSDLVPCFAMGYYFVFMYSFPVNFEFYKKQTKIIAYGTIIAACFNILLNYSFIKWWGLSGAVIATVISHGFQFLFHYILANYISSRNFPFKIQFFMPGLLAVCCSFLIYFVAQDLWYVRWGIGFLLGVYVLVKIIIRKEIF